MLTDEENAINNTETSPLLHRSGGDGDGGGGSYTHERRHVISTSTSTASMTSTASSSSVSEEGNEDRDNGESTSFTISHFTNLWKQHIKVELDEQLTTAIPTLYTMVLYKIPWLISLRFVGGLGAEELAAAALATTICNVTGMSLSVGLSSALTTLASQAKGELLTRNTNNANTTTTSSRDSRQQQAEQRRSQGTEQQPNSHDESANEPITTLVYLYRGLVLQMLIVLPVGMWWIYGTKDCLIYVGQTSTIAAMTDTYLGILAPGLWFYSISMTLTSWVQAIDLADVPAYASAVGLVLHIPLNYFFIYTLGFGYLGCAIATVCYQTIQPMLVLLYLFVYKTGKQRTLVSTGGTIIGRTYLSFWNEFQIAISSFKGIMQYLSLALPGIVIISEWWASEISIFLSGNLQPYPEIALSGMTIYQSINTFCFMFPVSFGIAGSARVGNLLGSGNHRQAKFAAQISVTCATLISALLGCVLMFAVPHTYFPSLFAPNEQDVIVETSKTIPLLSTCKFKEFSGAKGLKYNLSGIGGCLVALLTFVSCMITLEYKKYCRCLCGWNPGCPEWYYQRLWSPMPNHAHCSSCILGYWCSTRVLFIIHPKRRRNVL